MANAFARFKMGQLLRLVDTVQIMCRTMATYQRQRWQGTAACGQFWQNGGPAEQARVTARVTILKRGCQRIATQPRLLQAHLDFQAQAGIIRTESRRPALMRDSWPKDVGTVLNALSAVDFQHEASLALQAVPMCFHTVFLHQALVRTLLLVLSEVCSQTGMCCLSLLCAREGATPLRSQCSNTLRRPEGVSKR